MRWAGGADGAFAATTGWGGGATGWGGGAMGRVDVGTGLYSRRPVNCGLTIEIQWSLVPGAQCSTGSARVCNDGWSTASVMSAPSPATTTSQPSRVSGSMMSASNATCPRGARDCKTSEAVAKATVRPWRTKLTGKISGRPCSLTTATRPYLVRCSMARHSSSVRLSNAASDMSGSFALSLS